MKSSGLAAFVWLVCLGICDGALRQSQVRILASWTNSYFGQSVSLCDTVAVVGAYQDSVVSNYAGAAYVFEKQGTNWIQQAVLAAADPTSYYYFGWSVAVHGDTVVAGSDYANVANLSAAGRAYVFARSGTNWVQQAMLRASDAAANDHFGYSVGIYSTTIVVGAYYDDVGALSDAGSVYIFERQDTNWVFRVKLSGTNALDRVGASVSIHGDTIVAGAPEDDLPSKADAGSAFVYVRSGTNWARQAQLAASDSAASDNFGVSVSVCGSNVLVGAKLHDLPGSANAGEAYVYERQGTNWVQQAMLTAPAYSNGNNFGWGLSIWQDRAVVAAPGYSRGALYSGAGFIFGRSGTNWVYQDILVGAYATNTFYMLGLNAVSAWGDDIVLGTTADSTRGPNAGAAYIFAALENRPPVAADDLAETPEDTPVTINVLTNDTDADGESLSITNYTLPAHGGVTVGSWTNFEYAPSDNWNGTDTFTYVCADGSLGFGSATVTVVVVPVQDPPVAEADGAAFIGATSIAINVLANDFDPDGDPMTVTNVTAPDRGSAEVLAGGTSVLYTAAARYPGAHAFQYDVADGHGNTARGSVVVSVCVLASNAEACVSPAECTNEDQFGSAVALSGSRALVGAKLRDLPGTNNVGAVFVYERVAGVWTQQVMIPNPEPYADDVFGASVGLDADTALVGIPYYNSTTNYDSGAACVFVRDGADWVQQARLVAPEPHVGDYAGMAVALDGDNALIGAPYADYGDFYVSAGGAYLWARSGTNWSLQETFAATNPVIQFGRAVALDGDTAVVGHPYDDINTTNRSAGSVYVYARDGIAWPQQANLMAYDAAQTDRFGFAVAVQSNVVAVGAPYDDFNGLADAGSVYVFNRSGTNWSFGGKLMASDADSNRYFGLYLAMQGDSLLVGVPYNDEGALTDAGSVYVFARIGITWIQKTKLLAPDADIGDLFGAAVAVDGDAAVVGASTDDVGTHTNQGSAYFFLLDADEDGLGDALEAGLGSSPYNPDTDDDTLSDGAEYVGGTDPSVFTAPSNWFHAAGARRSSPVPGFVVAWPSLTGRLYRVTTATNLLEPGPWQDTDCTNMPGTGGPLMYTNAGSSAGAFFRLDVRLDPR